MTPNPKLGNRIILLSVAIVFAVASLFAQWGTIKLTADDLRDSMTINGQKVGMEGMLSGMMSSMLTGMTVPLTGQNGSVGLGPIKLPYWLAIAAVIFGLAVTITNATGISDVPRNIIRGLLGFGLVISLWALVVMLLRGSIGLGAFMLIGAAIAGLLHQQNQNRSDI
ncbi:hypothetical protein FEM03_12380 [Phragmitibacter flavus]|uniref:Uncharacterized protein n=1 Tax=Phragmitibacter flavus TaxID=2576071 RepID=A0A5R8KEV0_9BACT|nr:hypothetical protein [Phragmitibacter flavus]TLD70515.1 hypothetical protein FEM03_12380 [Phragmitibacter flavus]